MEFDTCTLCDYFPEDIDVVDPIFINFGGITSFYGEITTVKLFEDNGVLYKILGNDGAGKVLVIDGGGSMRSALIDKELALLAVENHWEGLIVFGAVRQVDALLQIDIGIQAIGAIPVGCDDSGIGESDIHVHFGGVTFFTGDYIYADNSGIILSETPLLLSEEEE